MLSATPPRPASFQSQVRSDPYMTEKSQLRRTRFSDTNLGAPTWEKLQKPGAGRWGSSRPRPSSGWPRGGIWRAWWRWSGRLGRLGRPGCPRGRRWTGGTLGTRFFARSAW